MVGSFAGGSACTEAERHRHTKTHKVTEEHRGRDCRISKDTCASTCCPFQRQIARYEPDGHHLVWVSGPTSCCAVCLLAVIFSEVAEPFFKVVTQCLTWFRLTCNMDSSVWNRIVLSQHCHCHLVQKTWHARGHSTEKKCLSDNGQLQRKHTTHSEHRPQRTTGELRCERGNEGDIASRGAGTGETLRENFLRSFPDKKRLLPRHSRSRHCHRRHHSDTSSRPSQRLEAALDAP